MWELHSVTVTPNNCRLEARAAACTMFRCCASRSVTITRPGSTWSSFSTWRTWPALVRSDKRGTDRPALYWMRQIAPLASASGPTPAASALQACAQDYLELLAATPCCHHPPRAPRRTHCGRRAHRTAAPLHRQARPAPPSHRPRPPPLPSYLTPATASRPPQHCARQNTPCRCRYQGDVGGCPQQRCVPGRATGAGTGGPACPAPASLRSSDPGAGHR